MKITMLMIKIVILISTILFANPQKYTAQFQLTSFGIEFQYGNVSNLYLFQSDVFTINRCATMCCIEQMCQTFDYDTSSRICRLFSIWVYEGLLISSASSTSIVGYIEHTSDLYSLYQTPCNTSYDTSRYLLCANNGLWSCQSGQTYNGTICLDTNLYNSYMTAIYHQQCLQNQTMLWNGTSCVLSE